MAKRRQNRSGQIVEKRHVSTPEAKKPGTADEKVVTRRQIAELMRDVGKMREDEDRRLYATDKQSGDAP